MEKVGQTMVMAKIYFTIVLWAFVFALFAQDANTFYQSGAQALKAGQYREAVQQFNKAIAINPDIYYYHYNRGMAHKNLKEYLNAITDFSECVRLNNNGNAYMHRGACYAAIGKKQEAKADFATATDLSPKLANQAFMYEAMLNFKDEEWQECVYNLDNFLVLNARDAQAYFYRAKAKLKMGDVEGALTDLKTVEKCKAGLYSVYDLTYQVYKELGDWENARTYKSIMIAMDPQNPLHYIERAEMNEKLGDQYMADIDRDKAKLLPPSGKADRSAVAYDMNFLF